MRAFFIFVLILSLPAAAYAPPQSSSAQQRVNTRIQQGLARIQAGIPNYYNMYQAFSRSNLNTPHRFRAPDQPSAGYTNQMYSGDSAAAMGDFFEGCFEPNRIHGRGIPFDGGCPACQPQVIFEFAGLFRPCIPRSNPGYTWEAWIPEVVIEINDFGISAINPVHFGRGDLAFEPLRQGTNQFRQQWVNMMSSTYGTPDLSRMPEPQGFSQTSGLEAGDVGYFAEAHAFTSAAQCNAAAMKPNGAGRPIILCTNPSWIEGRFLGILPFGTPLILNGYLENPLSFFDALNETQDPVIGFTEEPRAMQYWRILDKAADLQNLSIPYNLYAASRPPAMTDQSYVFNDCDNWRRSRFPQKFGDLPLYDALSTSTATGQDLAVGDLFCSADTVGDFFPPTGFIDSGVKESVSAAVLARRAYELFSYDGVGSGGRAQFFTKDMASESGDSLDKMQMVAPYATPCFTKNQIGEWNDALFQEPLFPTVTEPQNQDRSVRFVFWNKKRFCTCQYAGPQPTNMTQVTAAMSFVGGDVTRLELMKGSQIYNTNNNRAPTLTNDTCNVGGVPRANGDCSQWQSESPDGRNSGGLNSLHALPAVVSGFQGMSVGACQASGGSSAVPIS